MSDGHMKLSEYIAAHPDPQSGPCVICGATNYALSMGGPSICPWCDTGASADPRRNRARIEALSAERDRLAARVRELEAAVRWALGEEGEFPPRQRSTLTGLYVNHYWWRPELRKRAGVSPPAQQGGGE